MGTRVASKRPNDARLGARLPPRDLQFIGGREDPLAKEVAMCLNVSHRVIAGAHDRAGDLAFFWSHASYAGVCDRTRTGNVRLGKPRGYYAVSLWSRKTTTSVAARADRASRRSEDSELGGHSWALRTGRRQCMAARTPSIAARTRSWSTCPLACSQSTRRVGSTGRMSRRRVLRPGLCHVVLLTDLEPAPDRLPEYHEGALAKDAEQEIWDLLRRNARAQRNTAPPVRLSGLK